MNKAELISAVADKAGVPNSTASEVLSAFESVVVDTVAGGGKIALSGFLTFDSSKRAARKGRNPATGAEIDIPASTVPTIKAGKSFKDAVNK